MSKIIIILLSALLLFSSCAHSQGEKNNIVAISTDADGSYADNVESEYSDRYIDEFIFLGESTTYHLKSRGALSDGKATKQVWAPKSGTLMLDPLTYECRIVFPDTNEELELSEALNRKKPKYLMLTFGLNGATNFIRRGASYFKLCYKKLIDTVRENSRNTEIIINSCFPVAENMNMQSYSVTSGELNSYIETINCWARELAKEEETHYLDTASSIKDERGFLCKKYQSADGFHLNLAAYLKIIEYIKAHPISAQ